LKGDIKLDLSKEVMGNRWVLNRGLYIIISAEIWMQARESQSPLRSANCVCKTWMYWCLY